MDPLDDEFDRLRLRELEAEIAARRMDDTVGAGRRKAAVSGVATGLVGSTIGAPGDIGELVETGRKAAGVPRLLNLPPVASLLPSTEKILGGADNLTGSEFSYKPKTKEEQYVKSISSGVAGSVTPMGRMSALARMMLGGGAAGAGEAVEQFGGGPVGNMLTNLAVLFAGGKMASRKPHVVRALQDDLEPIGEEGLREAARKATEVEQTTGVRPILSQTTKDPTALSGITAEIGRSDTGRLIQKVLNREMTVGQEKIDDLIAQIYPDLVGQPEANRVLKAGEKALKRPADVANRLSQHGYRASKHEKVPADTDLMLPEDNPFSRWVRGVKDAYPEGGDPTTYIVPPVTVKDITAKLRSRAKELNLDPAVHKSGAAIEAAAQKLEYLAGKYPEGVPAGMLDELYKQERIGLTAAKSASASRKDKQRELAYQSITGIINDALKLDSPGLAEGKTRFARVMATQGEKMQKSPIPDMFPETMRTEGRGQFSTMGKVLTESEKYKPEDIRFVAQNLRRADPEAFPILVKQSWQDALERSRRPVEGRTPQQAMNQWVAEVAGPVDSQKRANFRETIRQVASIRGQDPEAAVRGADKLADALLAFSSDRRAVGKINPTETRKEASANALSKVLFPRWQTSLAMQRVLYRRTYEQIAEALISPDGVNKLVEIANFNPTEAQLTEYVRGLLTANAVGEAQ